MVIALHAALLLLMMASLDHIVVPQFPNVAPIMARLIDEPRGQHLESDRPALRPRFLRPSVNLADVPPNVRVEVPIEVAPAPQPSEVAASLLSGRGEVEGDGSPPGNSGIAGERPGPRLLHQVAPDYPAESVRAHEQGTVKLRVLVDARGTPSQVSIAAGSGFWRLDQSAIDAVRRYRFAAPAQDRVRQSSWTTVEVNFDLLRMPVPTSIVASDSVSTAQIRAAQRSVARLTPDIQRIDRLIRRLALRMLASLPAGRIAATPTPDQVLVTQGKLQDVRFLGFADRDFNCGTTGLPFDSAAVRCEIFEVRQTGGTSYWLSLVGDYGTNLENISIATKADPPGSSQTPR